MNHYCGECNHQPCLARLHERSYMNMIREGVIVDGQHMTYRKRASNKQMRFASYRLFCSWIHGPLGAGNRKELPGCIVRMIRVEFPEEENNYVGYIDN